MTVREVQIGREKEVLCIFTGTVGESGSLCTKQGNEGPAVTLKSIFITRDTIPDAVIYICYRKENKTAFGNCTYAFLYNCDEFAI
jgi:hypothetical protein